MPKPNRSGCINVGGDRAGRSKIHCRRADTEQFASTVAVQVVVPPVVVLPPIGQAVVP
jgi:hypothetical protein